MSWFSLEQLTQTPWTDFVEEPMNFFDIQEHPTRNFYINRNWGAALPIEDG